MTPGTAWEPEGQLDWQMELVRAERPLALGTPLNLVVPMPEPDAAIELGAQILRAEATDRVVDLAPMLGPWLPSCWRRSTS